MAIRGSISWDQAQGDFWIKGIFAKTYMARKKQLALICVMKALICLMKAKKQRSILELHEQRCGLARHGARQPMAKINLLRPTWFRTPSDQERDDAASVLMLGPPPAPGLAPSARRRSLRSLDLTATLMGSFVSHAAAFAWAFFCN